jgi:biofilm PGA synthesis N-glycosyltransferase PgaC
LRWAQGGAEVFLKQIRQMLDWKRRRMWGLVFEYCLSVSWSYALVLTYVLWAVGKFMTLPEGLNVPIVQPPQFWGLVLAVTCLIQFALALTIESRYEKGLAKVIGWTIWYPLFFWTITLLTQVVGLPKAIFARRGKRATWVSPDRGVRSSPVR